MLRCVNDGVKTVKPDHRQLETHARYAQTSRRPSRCSLHLEEFMFWRAPNRECLVPTVKHGTGEGSVMVWAAVSFYSVGPVITLHSRITAREYLDMQVG
jgi:hypothetical protein